MTIDYAKRQAPPAASKKVVWGWSLGIFISAISITTLLAFHHHKASQTTPSQKKSVIAHHNIKAPKQVTEVSPSQYDFYQMLAKMNVQTNATKSSGISNLKPGQPYYLLQVATSADQKGASELATKLGVMGLNASVKTIHQPSRPLYQVLVGPYAREKNAKTDQAYLRSSHIDSIELVKRVRT